MPDPTPEQIAAQKAADEKAAAEAAAKAAAAADPHMVEKDGEKLYKEKHVKDLRGEAQRNRERAEAAETKLREREAADEAAAAQKLKDEKKFEELADKERKRAEKAEQDAKDQVAARNRRIIKAEVKVLAKAAGLIDPDDVDLMALDSVKLDENDNVVGADKIIEDFKKSKPHKFGDPNNPRGGLGTDNPGAGGKPGDVDARKLSQKDFEELDKKLRAGRR